jgi:ankyrin repeat protein
LLQKGATVDAESPNGTTPLMMAAGYGSDVVVDMLLKRGADRTRKNQQGLDAAAFAKKAGRDGLAQRLAVSSR